MWVPSGSHQDPTKLVPFWRAHPRDSPKGDRGAESHLTLTLTTKEGNPPHGHPGEVTRTPQVARMLASAAWMMAGKEEGWWDGLVLMLSSWKVKPQNLRPAWAQVGPLPGWGPIINAVLMGCQLCLQEPLNFHLLAQTQPINVRQLTSNGC